MPLWNVSDFWEKASSRNYNENYPENHKFSEHQRVRYEYFEPLQNKWNDSLEFFFQNHRVARLEMKLSILNNTELGPELDRSKFSLGWSTRVNTIMTKLHDEALPSTKCTRFAEELAIVSRKKTLFVLGVFGKENIFFL